MHKVALLLALAVPAHARGPRSEVAVRALSQSVRIKVEHQGEVRRSATGVVVAARPGWAEVLTNAHVLVPIDGQSELAVSVLLADDSRKPARIAAVGRVPDLDLALLEVDGATLTAAELGQEGEVGVGDDVLVVGSPFGKSLTVSAGIVSQLEIEAGGRQRSMKTDAPIAYGSSGGGVFSVPGGRLVALVEGYRTARVAIGGTQGFDVPMPGETFLAPLGKVRAFLAENGRGPGKDRARTASGQ